MTPECGAGYFLFGDFECVGLLVPLKKKQGRNATSFYDNPKKTHWMLSAGKVLSDTQCCGHSYE